MRVGKDSLEYDRLIVSPGIDFQWEQIEGLAQAKDTVLHAWKAGPQTVQLAKQLQSMTDGGVVVMTVPPVGLSLPAGSLRTGIDDRLVSYRPRNRSRS